MCTRRSKVSAPLLRPSVMDIPDVFWSCVCVGCASLRVGICVASFDFFFPSHPRLSAEGGIDMSVADNVAQLMHRQLTKFHESSFKMRYFSCHWSKNSAAGGEDAASVSGVYLFVFLSVNVFMEIVMCFHLHKEFEGPRQSYKNTGRGLGHSVYFVLTVTYFVIFLLSWGRKSVTDVRLVSQHVTFCGDVALESLFFGKFEWSFNEEEHLYSVHLISH